MEKRDFIDLKCGRSVTILEVHLISNLGLGILEGDPEVVLKRQLESFEEDISKIITWPSNVHVVAPVEVDFEGYRLGALLHCYDATNEIDDFSNLILGMFVDSFDINLHGAISEVVSDIDWDRLAYNGGY